MDHLPTVPGAPRGHHSFGFGGWGLAMTAMGLSSVLVSASEDGGNALDRRPFTWTPCPIKPVLPSGPPGSWDENTRERMWVIHQDGRYDAWYAGWKGPYDKTRPKLAQLGYATSKDGVHWSKHPGNPIFTDRWTEDMCVVKDGDTYYMYAEDESFDRTVIHLLVSKDKVHWTPLGNVLESEPANAWEKGWVGTPLVWKEGARWHMLYEGGPPGDIALATSKDGRHWTRNPRNPVLTEGTGWEDRAVAPDSLIKLNGQYYLFYHACGGRWQSGLATSQDLIHWNRHPGNPIVPEPSPVLVDAPDRYLLYVHDTKAEPLGVYLYVSPK